jgi:addiction module HigA family antidote
MKQTRSPGHPGAILKRLYMNPLGLTVTDLADALHVSRKTISKIVNQRGAVTVEMALCFAQAFKTTPQLWLNMQQNYDLWIVSKKSAKWKSVKPLAA